VVVLLGLMLFGCSGIRYSEVAPEAKDFHPRQIGVLPVDVGTYEDARGVIDKIAADVLIDKKWFTRVVAAETINKQMSSEEDIRKIVPDYLVKLKTVSYSDPEMSKKIGELLKVDALLVVDIIYWNYTKTKEDDDMAKVEAEIKMINANTGQIIWKAHHYVAEEYTYFKPQLRNVAKNLINKMIKEMPR
jgi:hypothetical protein